MYSRDNIVSFFQKHKPEAKSDTSGMSQDARLRYRCAHAAWSAPGEDLDGDVIQALHRASRLLSQMHLSCQREVAPQQEAAACRADDLRKTAELFTQVHIQALLTLGAMSWLWQHSAWQLLAHPRNHIACTCLKVSQAMRSLLRRHLNSADHLPATKAQAQMIEASINRFVLEETRWIDLQVRSELWREMKPDEISLALSRLRTQYIRACEPAVAPYRGERNRECSPPDDGRLGARLHGRRVLNRMPVTQLEDARSPALALDAHAHCQESP